MGLLTFDHIKWLITLTSDYIIMFSLNDYGSLYLFHLKNDQVNYNNSGSHYAVHTAMQMYSVTCLQLLEIDVVLLALRFILSDK